MSTCARTSICLHACKRHPLRPCAVHAVDGLSDPAAVLKAIPTLLNIMLAHLPLYRLRVLLAIIVKQPHEKLGSAQDAAYCYRFIPDWRGSSVFENLSLVLETFAG